MISKLKGGGVLVAARVCLCAIGLLLASAAGNAQPRAQAPRAEFEVASIKPNKTNERMYFGLRGATLTVRNISLKGLIQIAYGKREFQIAGGPHWVSEETFDIDAKAEGPARATHEMMKTLLERRFGLALHSETKEAPAYFLVVARGGLKMKPSADQSDPERGGPKESGRDRIVGEGIPVYVLVNLLSNALGAAVIDRTGLTGKYDIDLRYVADSAQPLSGAGDAPPAAQEVEMALIAAVEKQLGLKLEAGRAPQEVLVIDRASHPTAN